MVRRTARISRFGFYIFCFPVYFDPGTSQPYFLVRNEAGSSSFTTMPLGTAQWLITEISQQNRHQGCFDQGATKESHPATYNQDQLKLNGKRGKEPSKT